MKLFTSTKKAPFAIILVGAILLSTHSSAHATTIHRVKGEVSTTVAGKNPNNNIMPFNTSTYYMGASNTFTTINVSFGATGGLFAVSVPNFQPWQYRMDIMMWGSSGLLWQEDDCLKYAIGRGFQCGGNVKRISLRIVPRDFASPRDFTVNISW